MPKRYEAAAAQIRAQGPMTIHELAASMRWSRDAAFAAINRARFHLLLIVVGKQPDGRFIFGAAQTMGDRQ